MGINVLSLFDGMSCGQIALDKLGIEVDNYFASEVDKYAMQIAKKNYPYTVHLGDVRNVGSVVTLDGSAMRLPKIHLLIGGSPCQGFSFAGKQLNFEDPRSKLFFEFVRILEETKPKYFLLENVKMKQESQDIITKYLGVEPVEINSALVSAQNRRRLYWTNIPGVTQPEDLELHLEDIIKEDSRKTNSFKDHSPYECKNYYQFDVSGKKYKSQQDRAYYLTSKFGCLPSARAITKLKVAISDGEYINLDLSEVEKLQTVPEGYTKLENGFSLNKSLGALGNGWTVDVIAHIFKGMIEDGLEILPKIGQPQDAGIKLKDELEEDPEEVTFMSDKFTDRFLGYGKRATDINSPKARNLSAREYEKNGRQGDYVVCFSTSGRATAGVEFRESDTDKAHTLSTSGYSNRSFSGVLTDNGLKLRKLTTIECERLQTVPDNYTEGVSNTQRYKMLGNGWTVDVISHILKGMSYE